MKLYKIFDEALMSFQKVDDVNHDQFIQKFYEQTYQNVEKAQEVHNEVNDYFERVDSNYKEIIQYKEKGLSRNKWFEEKLAHYEQLSPGSANEITNAIGAAHQKHLKNYDVESLQKPVTVPFASVGKRIIMNSLDKSISENTYITMLETEQLFSNTESQNGDPATMRYFEETLDVPYDTSFKKLGTATVLRVQESGKVKLLEDKSPTEIAAIVDRTYTTAKVGYKIAKGELKASNATDYLIDRSVARIEAIVHRKAKEYVGKLGMHIGAALGSYFGPIGAAIGGTVGKVIGEKAEKFVAEKVTGGIKKVASYAKEKVDSIVNSIASTVSSVVGKIFSWF